MDYCVSVKASKRRTLIQSVSYFVANYTELKFRIVSSYVGSPFQAIVCEMTNFPTISAENRSELKTTLDGMSSSATNGTLHCNGGVLCSSHASRSGRVSSRLFGDKINVDGVFSCF